MTEREWSEVLKEIASNAISKDLDAVIESLVICIPPIVSKLEFVRKLVSMEPKGSCDLN